MIHIQFSIYDSAAQAYLPPFILPREEMAKRTFADCVNSAEHQFAAHPEDYTLFRLGTWDDETALFNAEANGAQSLGNGVIYVRIQNTDSENAEDTTGPTTVGDDAPVQPGSERSDSEE